MTKQTVTQLSKVKRLSVETKQSKGAELIYLNAEQYEDMKPQLEKTVNKSGLKRLIFSDGEVATINEKTVVLINDL